MKLSRYLLGSTMVAALGGFLFGFDTAVISGTDDVLTRVFGLTGNLLGLTVASALIGTILGSMVAGKPAEWLGRKPVLRWLAVLYFFSALGCGCAWDWIPLLAFRFLGGIAIGGASVVSPMYIAEIAPPRLRGRLVAVSQLNVVLGILTAFLCNYLISLVTQGDVNAWRWMLGIVAVPAALFFLLVLPIPESPRWLVKRHRREEALRVLEDLGNDDAPQVLQEIVDSLHEETVGADEPFFQRKYMRPILLAIMVATFNQLSGINAVIYYTRKIFEMAGAGRTIAMFLPVVIGVTNLVFTVLAMSIIDRFGRKRLLMVGAVGLAACLGTTSYAYYQGLGVTVVLVCLIGYVAFFAFSQGAVIWVFLSEIFPNRVRARGQALGSFTHWFWCAIVSWLFPVMVGVQSSGSLVNPAAGNAFAFFAAMMVLQLVMVARFMPETKGVSLEQIQRQLGIE